MRSAVSAVLIAGVTAQLGATQFSTTSFGPATASSSSMILSPAPAPKSTSTSTSTSTSGSAQTRGLPIGTINGIQDSDVVCAQNGGVGAACGLANVPSIYNPNPALRYQTQYSDNAISLIQATNCYNAAGQRIVGQNGACNGNTYNIPTQNAAASGVVTTTANGIPLSQTTNWLNNGALANYITPSASNSVLPNSAAFVQANLAPQTTTPVNTLTGAGFGYSTLLGQTAGSVSAPVVSPPPLTTYSAGLGSYGLPLSSYSTLGSSIPLSSYSTFGSSAPLTGYPSFGSSIPLNSYSTIGSGIPLSSYSSFGTGLPMSTGYFPTTSFSSFPTTSFSSFPTTSFSSFPTNSFSSFNPAAQPFTNAYSTPGVLGAPSQLGIVRH